LSPETRRPNRNTEQVSNRGLGAIGNSIGQKIAVVKQNVNQPHS